ncbi:MAG: hypothetical protein R3F59_27895 [Myxococcota bacterium]
MLWFPDGFTAAFPSGGELAAVKLELAEYLKRVEPEALPSDAAFFRALDRHARSASLVSQRDAQIVRSLREEFGAAGLASLIAGLPPRIGALLFALAPPDEQQEMIRLLSPRQVAAMADQLLRSNRMDPAETAYVFRMLEAVRRGEPVPTAPHNAQVTDRGTAFDAPGALSALLPSMDRGYRAALFNEALERSNGSLPDWYRGIFVADMLFELHDEARTDLLLELDTEVLAAWLSVVRADTRQQLLDNLPESLRTSLQAMSVFPSRARQLQLAEQGRQALARAFQRQLARVGLPFEQVVLANEPAPPAPMIVEPTPTPQEQRRTGRS